MDRYESLVDAVNKRCGWTFDGITTPEHLAKIGMGPPEVIAIVEKNLWATVFRIREFPPAVATAGERFA